MWYRRLPSTLKAEASTQIAPIKQPLDRGAGQESKVGRLTSQPQSLTSESGGHAAASWSLWVPGGVSLGPCAIPLSLSPKGQLVQCRRWAHTGTQWGDRKKHRGATHQRPVLAAAGRRERSRSRLWGPACGQTLPLLQGVRASLQNQPSAAQNAGGGQKPTHLGELLLQLLPLLVVGFAQLLAFPDQQAQLAQGPRVQVLRVLPQHPAQALCLAGELCPGLQWGGAGKAGSGEPRL